MTDRVLTPKEVDELADLNGFVINGLPRANVCVLIASHRLLWAELQAERKLSNDLAANSSHDMEMERTREVHD